MSSGRSRDSAAPHADSFAAALQTALDQTLCALNETLPANPVVVIDGRSGAGKSTLARALAGAWPRGEQVQLVALDSLYPGWDGLAAGAEAARRDILTPHARGLPGVWRRHDWTADAPAESHTVDPLLPLIVEGCGALTPRSRPLCDIALWVDGPPVTRRARALARDGEAYRPHWERWAAQESQHIAVHDPAGHASLVLWMP